MRPLRAVLGKGKERGFFFEKKKQKTFLNWAVLLSRPPAQIRKSFCAAFFKKRPLSFPLIRFPNP
jgi:hypothetical protein